jgi:hypothetical protein
VPNTRNMSKVIWYVFFAESSCQSIF